MLAALAKRYEMHPEVANTIFLSWCFVVITGIVRSNILIQVESVAEPPTVVSTDVYIELPPFSRLSSRLTPPPFADIVDVGFLATTALPLLSLSVFLPPFSLSFSPYSLLLPVLVPSLLLHFDTLKGRERERRDRPICLTGLLRK